MKRILKDKKGASLVSVIVAFLLLMILLLMFQKSLQLSGNLVVRSVDIRKEEQELIGSFYQNKETPSQTSDAVLFFFGDSGSFSLNTKWSVYRGQRGSIFYFGDGTTGYERLDFNKLDSNKKDSEQLVSSDGGDAR